MRDHHLPHQALRPRRARVRPRSRSSRSPTRRQPHGARGACSTSRRSRTARWRSATAAAPPSAAPAPCTSTAATGWPARPTSCTCTPTTSPCSRCRTCRWSRTWCATWTTSSPSTSTSSRGSSATRSTPEKEILQSPQRPPQARHAHRLHPLRLLLQLAARRCGARSNYLGPAALLKAYRFEVDSRDEARRERLPRFDNERGVYRCHTITNCIEACPKELNPTEGIQWLKKAAVRRRLFGRGK